MGWRRTSMSWGRTEVLAQAGDRADEAHHEVVGGVLVELAGPADLLDLAVVHDHDPVGHLHGLLLVVGDEHGGHVDLVVQAAQPGPQLLADLGVEGAEGLVQQQHARLRRPGRGPGPCAGAGRPTAGPGSGRRAPGSWTSSSSSSTRARISALGRRADLEPEGDVLAHRHVLERGVVLEHEARRRAAAAAGGWRRGRRSRRCRRRAAPARRSPAAGSTCRCRWARAGRSGSRWGSRPTRRRGRRSPRSGGSRCEREWTSSGLPCVGAGSLPAGRAGRAQPG